MEVHRLRSFLSILAFLFGTNLVSSQGFWAGIVQKSEAFDRDPGWEGFNNHVQPARRVEVTQDFGFSFSEGTKSNERRIGGRVTRSSRPCYYAQQISPRTLNEKLYASGTFKLTASSGSSGIFFGWFNSKQPGGSGRPIGSFGMDFDGEGGGARLAVRMISKSNKSCGTFITPFIPGKYRPTPIRKDGTVYRWQMEYDPDANEGKGRFTVTVQSDSTKHEDFEGKTFTVDLPDGFKKDGATFDRFGLMNAMKAGGPMTIYFGDLVVDSKKVDPSGWIGSSNREKYEEPNQVGAHDFGFSEGTTFAGGSPGEMGGKFWRSGSYAYYADKVGRLALTQALEASGKVALLVGAPDSDMFIGWFNSTNKQTPPVEAGNFLGIHVGGPTRVGHYFQPAYTTAKGNRGGAKTGPVLVPEKVYDWKLTYNPSAEQGRGAIKVTLGDETVTAALKEGQKEEGTTFDRFGVFTSNIGGQMVQIYFDDLKYSADITSPNR